MKSPILACLLALCTAPTLLYAADAPGDKGQPTLQLGTVQVQGEAKIMAALRAIKSALKTPFSDDPAHADDPVCRIVKQLGEAREYLDCATNRDYAQRRDATQIAVFSGTLGVPGGADLLRSFLAKAPQHHIRTQVNGAGLQALLARIPDVSDAAAPAPVVAPLSQAVPAAATQKAPASATSQPST